MDDNKNSYESIKSDIKETGISLFLIGGMILFGIIVLAGIGATLQSKLDDGLKAIITLTLVAVLGLVIFNGNFRMWIVGSWLILLVAIPVLFILFCIGYMLFNLSKLP